MECQRATPAQRHRSRLLAAYIVAGALAALLLSRGSWTARAQEPTPTQAAQEAVTRLSIVAPSELILEGEQFGVTLRIDDVAHLQAFQVFIEYDHNLLSLKEAQMEPFFTEAERQDECSVSPAGWVILSGDVEAIEQELQGVQGAIVQANPERAEVTAWFPASQTDRALELGNVERTRVFINCISLGGPVSAGGPPGVSGSDALATMTFEAVAGGQADLQIQDSLFLLDDVDPPDDPSAIVPIPHETQNASVQLEGSSGDFPWLIVGAIIGAVAFVVIGAVGALWSRRSGREPLQPPSS